MKLDALFPICGIETCELKGRHHHLLPRQAEFIHAPEKFVAYLGGYGSGKTLAGAVKCLLMMLRVPGNRIFIGRRTTVKLRDNTLRIFVEVLERSGIDYIARENRDGLPYRVILPNGSEAVARDTSQIGRFLGPEYGGFWLDEASEEPETTFTNLMGRLRLPHAGAHLFGILTSNPPHEHHWIPTRFGTEPGVVTLGQSGYRLIRQSTRENTHLPPGYLADLLANYPPSEIRRVIDGEYGFAPDGKPVYAPPFRHEIHIGTPILRAAPLIRGWDFGYRHPVCLFQQIWRCRLRVVHRSVLAEFDGKHIEAEEFGQKVIEYTRQVFPVATASLILDTGDHSGTFMSDKGPGAIVRLRKHPFNLKFISKKISEIDPGLALVRQELKKGLCACGVPVTGIHRRCKHLIDAYAGGYHYPEYKASAIPQKERPVKDGFYDDFADADRYIVENYLRRELRDPGLIEALMDRPAPATMEHFAHAFAWLEQN